MITSYNISENGNDYFAHDCSINWGPSRNLENRNLEKDNGITEECIRTMNPIQCHTELKEVLAEQNGFATGTQPKIS